MFLKYIRFLFGLNGCVLAKLSTFYTSDLLRHISDRESSTSLDTSHFKSIGIHNLLSFWDPHMALASCKIYSWMYPHYYWQMVQPSTSCALLPSPFPTSGPLQRRRNDRKEGSVAFHVTMIAEARSLYQKETQECYLK